jgi:hypothetical protein
MVVEKTREVATAGKVLVRVVVMALLPAGKVLMMEVAMVLLPAGKVLVMEVAMVLHRAGRGMVAALAAEVKAVRMVVVNLEEAALVVL